MNSLKRVRAFQIELEFGSVGFWVQVFSAVKNANRGENCANFGQGIIIMSILYFNMNLMER